MVTDSYTTNDIDNGKKYYGFRYPDIKGYKIEKEHPKGKDMIDGWKRFVSWMAHSNPQPMYEKIEILNAEEFEAASRNPQTGRAITLYTFKDKENGVHEVVTEYDSTVTDYYKKTVHVYGYTNEKLPESVT
jgi:hypothetical protein